MVQQTYHPTESFSSASRFSDKLATKRASRSYTFQRVTCLLLHALLVVLHVIPIPLWILGSSSKFDVHLDQTTFSRISGLVAAVPQGVVLVLTTLLVFMTQKLALKREVHYYQYLTTLHDKSTAWQGLGSALRTIVWQCSMGSKAHSIISVFLYLLGVFVLQITSPAIFHLAVVEAPRNIALETALGRPTLNDTHDQRFPAEAYSILNLLSSSPGLTFPGLAQNTVYDTLPSLLWSTFEGLSPDNNIEVNGTSFEINCHTLPNATAAPLTNDANQPVWVVDLDSSNSSSYDVSIPVLGYPSIMAFTPNASSTDGPSTVIIASTVDIHDSTGTSAPNVTTSPEIANSQSGLILLACDISPLKDQVAITLDNLPLTGISSSSPTPHPFQPWQRPSQPPSDPLSTMLNTSTIPAAPTNGPGLSCNTTDGSTGQTAHACANPSVLDVFITTAVGLGPSALSGASSPNVSLVALEGAVANALAAVTWFTGHMNGPDGKPSPFQRGLGEAHSLASVMTGQFALNGIPLVVGLLVSFFLLCAAAIMTRKPPSFQNHPSLDGPGVLQLAWLFGRDPTVAQHIAGATYDPSVHALRGAGMMKANLTSATHYGPPGAVGGFGMGDMSNSMQFHEPRPITDEGVPIESARLLSDPHHSEV